MNLNVLFIGLAEGSVYGLLAAPIVLAYRLTGVANFAQGAMAGVATFVVYTLLDAGLPGVVAVVAGAVFAAGLGCAVYGLLRLQTRVAKLDRGDHITSMIVTLGVFEVLNAAMVLIWGPDARPLGLLSFATNWRLDVGPVHHSVLRFLPLVLLLVAAAVYYLVVHRTGAGLVMRATAADDESAATMGINVGRVKTGVWAVAGVVGLAAGISASSIYFVSPDLTTSLLIPAFVAAILGGMEDVTGAAVGGLLVGLLTAVAAEVVGTEFKGITAIVLAGLILIVRPRGILARTAARTV